ncbi:MAG: hypothetical protein KDD90_04710 [Sphingomonadaceae bacterium]|nr:hypothetical protein [Sphingomonadaceae bacterium]
MASACDMQMPGGGSMQVTSEQLAAYASGELAGEDKARVAKALAADPELRRQLLAHRQVLDALPVDGDQPPERDRPEARTEAVDADAPQMDEAVVAKRALPRWSYFALLALVALFAAAVFILGGWR